MGRSNFFLLHDNVPSHTATKVVQFLAKKGITILSHPPPCPILVPPPDYFQFPKLKLELKGTKFDTIEYIMRGVTTKLKRIPEAALAEAMERLLKLANRCSVVHGDYFE